MWASEYDMNLEIYEYKYIPRPPTTDGIGNFMKWGREMFFQQLSF